MAEGVYGFARVRQDVHGREKSAAYVWMGEEAWVSRIRFSLEAQTGKFAHHDQVQEAPQTRSRISARWDRDGLLIPRVGPPQS